LLRFGFVEKFIRKMCAYNVDEIDSSSQFHQHFTSSFCANILASKKLQSQTLIREKMRKALLCEIGTRKMLMKLTPWLVGGVTIAARWKYFNNFLTCSVICYKQF